MPFPVTYVLDHLAPSETFIRREIEQLRNRNWPIFTRLLNGGVDALHYSLLSCPEGMRVRLFRSAFARVSQELLRDPAAALRILRRIPQAADLAAKVLETDSVLIHAHFAGITADIASIVSATTGVPWTCSIHAHDVFTAEARATGRRLRTASAVTACSRLAATAVTDAGIAPDKVVMIHHGIHLNDFPFDTIQPDGTVLAACRLEPKKGVDTLIKACALLKAHDVGFSCVIAGDGPMRASLVKLSRRLGVVDTVDFIGWQSQEETRSQLIDTSLLVLPSRVAPDGDRDGIANVLVEAMALGTPILTTTASAASEIVADSVNGILVPPDDPMALADAIQKALVSKDRLIAMAKAARKTVEAEFDAYKNIRELEAFFERAVAPKP